MPPKKKPRRDISGLKNQPKVTTDSSHTNEAMSCASDTAAPPVLRLSPESNPFPEYHGRVQKMTTESGEQKGLQQTLEERGFNVSRLRAKCAPVCPFENDDCCMARILSKQDDFANQISVLENVIREADHECIFLPKFHCELNPIEMVSPIIPH